MGRDEAGCFEKLQYFGDREIACTSDGIGDPAELRCFEKLQYFGDREIACTSDGIGDPVELRSRRTAVASFLAMTPFCKCCAKAL